jgi:hypothetical protein
MSPHEVGLILEYNQPVERYGVLTVDDIEELTAMRESGEGFI